MVKIMISFNHIVDIIYIIIGVITIISFAKKGFVKAFFEHGRPFLAGVTAYKLGPILGKYFFDKYIFGGVTGWVSSKIETVVHIMTDKIDPEAIIDATPFIVRQFINTGKVQNDLQSMVENADASAYELSSVIATPFSKLLSNFLAYMIVFLVALLVFTLVGKLFDLIAKLPVLRGVNTILGMIFGIVAAFVLLSVITYFLSIIIGTFGNILSLEKFSENSYLFGFFDWIHMFDLL